MTLQRFSLLAILCSLFASAITHAQEATSDSKRNSKNIAKALPQPTRAVTYKKVGDRVLELQIFDPPAKTDAPKRAAIVFFFGGGWTSGSTSQFYPQAQHLADLGVLAICADYRVRSRDNVPVIECTADAQDAIAYVRDHAEEFNVDPKRIAAAGGSAGGHLAAACATVAYKGTGNRTPDDYRPDALVLFNPGLLLGPAAELKTTEQEQAKIAALANRLGDKPEQLSPYHQLTKTLPPTLILHGQADTTVPYKTVELFTNKAKQMGCDCTLIGYADEQHGFFNYQRNQSKYEATRDEMVKFLKRLSFVK